MKCTSRLQLGDMGYQECQLEKGHEGNHSFTHIPNEKNRWPHRKHTITWEQNRFYDFIITEEILKNETNLLEICEGILKEFDNFLSYKYSFEDDSLYGETPIVWVYFNSNIFIDFDNLNDEEWENYRNFEYETYKYIEDNLKLNNGDKINIQLHLTINTLEEENKNIV